jgi:hypothetical protein
LRYQKRDGFIEVQDFADAALAVISQPKGVPLDALLGFSYDSVAGEGVTVYVIDEGVDTTNSVSTSSNSTKD